MNESSHRTAPDPVTMAHEAASSSVHHLGPTADRYHAAMVRYLNAIAGDAARPHPEVARRPAPATLVSDVMTRDVIAAHEDAPFKEIVAMLARNRVSAAPVIDDDRKVIGVVSESDLISHMAVDGSGGPSWRHEKLTATRKKSHGSIARDLMTAPPVTTRAHATITDAARTAARAGVRHLPVVDAEGRLIGIVSRSDLLRMFLRQDGEIREEIEQYGTHAMRLDPTTFSVEVHEGVVTLTGKLERELLVVKLINHIRGISGVVDVDSHLTARFDDRYFPPPANQGQPKRR